MTVVASDHSPLEVYLVPLAVAKYELYCETSDDNDPTESASEGGGVSGSVRGLRRHRKAVELNGLPPYPPFPESLSHG